MIDYILKLKRTPIKLLHSIDSHLNHAAYLIPSMHHFLSPIRALRMACEKSNKTVAFIPTIVQEDLILCKKLLNWAKTGISLNLVTFCFPTVYLRSETCKYGLRGYNLYMGKAQRLQIPSDLTGRTHINILEFFCPCHFNLD